VGVGEWVGWQREFAGNFLFSTYLRRLILEQIEFYYPTTGREREQRKSSFSFYFITPKLCIRVRRRWRRRSF